jgi:hypothetical protein
MESQFSRGARTENNVRFLPAETLHKSVFVLEVARFYERTILSDAGPLLLKDLSDPIQPRKRVPF